MKIIGIFLFLALIIGGIYFYFVIYNKNKNGHSRQFLNIWVKQDVKDLKDKDIVRLRNIKTNQYLGLCSEQVPSTEIPSSLTGGKTVYVPANQTVVVANKNPTNSTTVWKLIKHKSNNFALLNTETLDIMQDSFLPKSLQGTHLSIKGNKVKVEKQIGEAMERKQWYPETTLSFEQKENIIFIKNGDGNYLGLKPSNFGCQQVLKKEKKNTTLDESNQFEIEVAIDKQDPDLKKEFLIIPNFTLKGHDEKILKNKSRMGCAEACRNEKDFDCKSFDYHGKSGTCWLQKVTINDDGTELQKRPKKGIWSYNHRRDQTTFDNYISIPNMEISNIQKTLQNKSKKECAEACTNENQFDCKSFNYYKRFNSCMLSKNTPGLKHNTLKKQDGWSFNQHQNAF